MRKAFGPYLGPINKGAAAWYFTDPDSSISAFRLAMQFASGKSGRWTILAPPNTNEPIPEDGYICFVEISSHRAAAWHLVGWWSREKKTFGWFHPCYQQMQRLICAYAQQEAREHGIGQTGFYRRK